VLAIGESAADLDPDLAEFRARGHRGLRSEYAAVAAALSAAGLLDPELDEDSAADTLYAIANDAVYLRLTRGRDWTAPQYAAWLMRLLERSLLAPPAID
jgi:hypothetical protein